MLPSAAGERRTWVPDAMEGHAASRSCVNCALICAARYGPGGIDAVHETKIRRCGARSDDRCDPVRIGGRAVRLSLTRAKPAAAAAGPGAVPELGDAADRPAARTSAEPGRPGGANRRA